MTFTLLNNLFRARPCEKSNYVCATFVIGVEKSSGLSPIRFISLPLNSDEFLINLANFLQMWAKMLSNQTKSKNLFKFGPLYWAPVLLLFLSNSSCESRFQEKAPDRVEKSQADSVNQKALESQSRIAHLTAAVGKIKRILELLQGVQNQDLDEMGTSPIGFVLRAMDAFRDRGLVQSEKSASILADVTLPGANKNCRRLSTKLVETIVSETEFIYEVFLSNCSDLKSLMKVVTFNQRGEDVSIFIEDKNFESALRMDFATKFSAVFGNCKVGFKGQEVHDVSCQSLKVRDSESQATVVDTLSYSIEEKERLSIEGRIVIDGTPKLKFRVLVVDRGQPVYDVNPI